MSNYEKRRLWSMEEDLVPDRNPIHPPTMNRDKIEIPILSSYADRQAFHDKEVRKWSQTPDLNHKYFSFFNIVGRSFVIIQEIALTSLIFSFHENLANNTNQYPKHKQDLSEQRFQLILSMIMVTFVIILYHSDERISHQYPHSKSAKPTTYNFTSAIRLSPFRIFHVARKRYDQMLFRLTDAFLLCGILRLLSSVLRTLTASYSSDTVTALANAGMLVHLLACDYAYANGITDTHDTKLGTSATSPQFHPQNHPITKTKVKSIFHRRKMRPTFQGGTVSLNAAFFSTTLLASRLPSDLNAFAFVSSSVIAFAFYPAARHNIAKQCTHFLVSPCTIITGTLYAAATIALEDTGRILLHFTFLGVCIISPFVKYKLQCHKQIISGPWDIAHLDSQSLQ